MYRIVFFKIPFMRGGYRVPVCPVINAPITYMGAWKVAEVVTDLAFAETQREIIVDGATAAAADDGKSNYVYIAQTTNSAVGVYTDDVRGAYYWLDDLQFVGVQDGSDTPAAVVTISPDVWLTDFCSGYTSVRGRLAQSSLLLAGEPRTPLVAPIYNIDNTIQIDALPARSVYDDNYWAVGMFAADNGHILTYAIPASSWAETSMWVNLMGAAAKITQTPKTGSADPLVLNVNCVRIYVLPAAFVEYAAGMPLFAKSTLVENRLESAGGAEYDDMYIPSYSGDGAGLVKTFVVNLGNSSENFLALGKKAWLVTPARFVELSAARGMTDAAWNDIPPAAVYISMAGNGDDGIKLYLQTGDEFIDISDDYIADFAANDASVRQAQQKQLVALQAITGVIGAAGGVAGGVASGNYFGAVQAAAGGVGSIAGLAAARRSPAQIRGNGGVASFFAMARTLLLAVSLGDPINLTRFQKTEAELGWQYDNAPYYDDVLEYDKYYRFSDVVIYGDMTGGQGAQQEVANALVSGVRLVDISKL